MRTESDMAFYPAPDDAVSYADVAELAPLQQQCAVQEAELNHAAENIETRGVKLLLHAYAQQRAAFARQLTMISQPGNGQPEEAGDTVKQGVDDIAASMTLGREDRRKVAMDGVIDGERKLLQMYTQALRLNLPGAVRDLIEQQRNQIAAGYDRLVELSLDGYTEPVTRVFEQGRAADEAVALLQRNGFTPAEYEVFDVDDLPVHRVEPREIRRSMGATVGGGALTGALVGGLFGLAFAIYQSFFPNMALNISVNPWLIFLASAAAGAFMGAVFGWIIGRNKVETDQFVYEDSLAKGTRLVVVYATPERAADAHRILQVYHDRELHKE